MATAEQKNELEKICGDLEAKITAKNQELADLNKAIHARIDSGEGDLRMSKLVLENEIRELENKKDNIANVVTAALAEVTSEKLRLAQEAEKLKNQQAELRDDLAKLDLLIKGIENRDAEFQKRLDLFNENERAFNAKIAEAQETIKRAAIDKSDAASLKSSAEAMYADADAARLAADNSVASIKEKTDKILKDAEAIKAEVEIQRELAAAEYKIVKDMKAEYTKKLEESEAWAMDNSKLSDKLSSWEAALQSEHFKLQDEKAKLAIAEKAFAAKNKGEN